MYYYMIFIVFLQILFCIDGSRNNKINYCKVLRDEQCTFVIKEHKNKFDELEQNKERFITPDYLLNASDKSIADRFEKHLPHIAQKLIDITIQYGTDFSESTDVVRHCKDIDYIPKTFVKKFHECADTKLNDMISILKTMLTKLSETNNLKYLIGTKMNYCGNKINNNKLINVTPGKHLNCTEDIIKHIFIFKWLILKDKRPTECEIPNDAFVLLNTDQMIADLILNAYEIDKWEYNFRATAEQLIRKCIEDNVSDFMIDNCLKIPKSDT